MKSFLSLAYTRTSRAFTALEVVVYVAILSIALVIVIEGMTHMAKAYGHLRSAQHIQNAGVASLDRLVREIRDAQSVTTAQSIFDTSPGRLVLATTNASSTPEIVEFYVENGLLKMRQDALVLGPLHRSKVSVQNLVFRHATTTRSEAVKIELTFVSTSSGQTKSETFYATALLRESY